VLLLALDTATPAVTVGVSDGQRTLAERSVVDPRRHGELLAPLIGETLAAAGVGPRDLTDVAVGVGPGPFTGLRVGVATAAAMSDALDLPIHGVCTLDVLARAAVDLGLDEPFAVATDARRREVYWATYDESAARIEGPAVARPVDLVEQLRGPVVGQGAVLYKEYFEQGAEVRSPAPYPEFPSAAILCALVSDRLAAGGELLPPVPLYLRRPDATPPKPRTPARR
jgi:tRNA threonylcarbamoyl adenosine modification protein YeaZ